MLTTSNRYFCPKHFDFIHDLHYCILLIPLKFNGYLCPERFSNTVSFYFVSTGKTGPLFKPGRRLNRQTICVGCIEAYWTLHESATQSLSLVAITLKSSLQTSSGSYYGLERFDLFSWTNLIVIFVVSAGVCPWLFVLFGITNLQ